VPEVVLNFSFAIFGSLSSLPVLIFAVCMFESVIFFCKHLSNCQSHSFKGKGVCLFGIDVNKFFVNPVGRSVFLFDNVILDLLFRELTVFAFRRFSAFPFR